MSPKLTPYERHIRDLARVRMRAQRAKARQAVAMLFGIVAIGLGAVAMLVPLQGKASDHGSRIVVLNREGHLGRIED